LRPIMALQFGLGKPHPRRMSSLPVFSRSLIVALAEDTGVVAMRACN